MNDIISESFPREDYRELVDLVVIFGRGFHKGATFQKARYLSYGQIDDEIHIFFKNKFISHIIIYMEDWNPMSLNRHEENKEFPSLYRGFKYNMLQCFK